MKLVGFSITNFRSITKAHKLPISDYTVLIGKNNEGKSNILNALAAAMDLIRIYGNTGLRSLRLYRSIGRKDLYDWERDFPIQLQAESPNGKTVFRLEFELNRTEIEEFKKEIKSNLNGTLPIEIRIGNAKEPQFVVIKKGPGSQPLQKKSPQICQFIGQRIDFTYIPAVRTSSAAIRVVEEMVSKELSVLEDNSEFIKALKKISELQQPILDRISQNTTERLRHFIPQITSVEIKVSDEARYNALRRHCEVIIDDGTATHIERKGDGVKSLAAISLMRGQQLSKSASVLALEEPESHLHPNAIHRLKEVIYELSRDHQVVVSTHSPIFVDRINMSSNLIIDSKKARAAKQISEIRDILGVRASDNLLHAKMVLIVEGDDDKASLTYILADTSIVLRNSINNGSLVIEPLHGASNLSYLISLYRSMICEIHAYLDNDPAGRAAIERAIEQGVLKESEYQCSICNGMADSEIEDIFNTSVYRDQIIKDYGVDINNTTFRNRKSKWTERIRQTFLSSGKSWNTKTENKVKNTVSKCVIDNVAQALEHNKRSSIDALISALESRLA